MTKTQIEADLNIKKIKNSESVRKHRYYKKIERENFIKKIEYLENKLNRFNSLTLNIIQNYEYLYSI